MGVLYYDFVRVLFLLKCVAADTVTYAVNEITGGFIHLQLHSKTITFSTDNSLACSFFNACVIFPSEMSPKLIATLQ